MRQPNHISSFVKYFRTKYRMTQEQLAEKAGVGLRFIRDLEQGKETLRMDKVNQVLALFGCRVVPGTSKKKDQWEIIMNHMNRNVHVYLKDRTVLTGLLLDYKMEDQEVKSWHFVSNNNALRYRDTKDESLVQIISDEEIINVENI
ncbi:MAG: helix-turn-helix transcriptional regulator [Chitinophagaceae bacterium]|nr:helix-turn-helix transcriptional regulator [Chitinophagaceae bacterium]